MIDEWVEAIISDHEIEAECKGGHKAFTKLSLLILHNSSFEILKFKAVSLCLLEVDCLIHIFPKVTLIILNQDKLDVDMSLIQGRKSLDIHFELAAIVQLYLFICITPIFTLVFYVELLASEVVVVNATLTTHILLGLAFCFEDVERQGYVLNGGRNTLPDLPW